MRDRGVLVGPRSESRSKQLSGREITESEHEV